MNLLLDTHVYLWWLRDDRRLAPPARETIADPSSSVFVSAATIWEAGIKIALRRLDVSGANLVEEVEANGFQHLSIHSEHAWSAATLPHHHTDPFDRMLVAQTILENLVLVSRDARLDAYDVVRLHA